jgi:hypothetical protein
MRAKLVWHGRFPLLYNRRQQGRRMRSRRTFCLATGGLIITSATEVLPRAQNFGDPASMTSARTPPVDFSRAYLSWRLKDGTTGQWRVIASAYQAGAEEADRFVLAPMVMAGNVFGSGRLPKDPPYSFQFLASSRRHAVLRDFGPGTSPGDSAAENGEVFAAVMIETPPLRATRIDVAALAAEKPTELWPMTARVTVQKQPGPAWILEFPVNHLNHRKAGGVASFQIETGPVLVPEALIEGARVTRAGGFALAYAYFNRSDRVDLALFGPTAMPERGRGYVHFERLDGLDIELFRRPAESP